jgi:beta-galactosidase
MRTQSRILFMMVTISLLSLLLQAQELYIGANYHPHDDKNPQKIQHDIQLMKNASH